MISFSIKSFEIISINKTKIRMAKWQKDGMTEKIQGNRKKYKKVHFQLPTVDELSFEYF